MKANKEFLQKHGALIFRIIACVICWISILITLISSVITAVNVGNLDNIFRSLSYYTMQTNYMVLIWITVALIYTKKEEKPVFLSGIVRGAITLYISITFLVFAVALQAFYHPTDPLEISMNILLHYLIPILFIIDWVITAGEESYKKVYALYWLIYPLIYLVYSLIRGLIINWYPYFFIDLNRFGALIILFIAILTLLFYSLGRVYIFGNQKLYDKKKK